MQGRQSGAPTGARAVSKRWLAPTALLLVAAAAAGWWWQSQAAVDEPTDALPRLSLQADASNAGDADAPAFPAAATIVEEAPAAVATAPAGTAGADDELDPAFNPMLVMARPDPAPQATPSAAGSDPNPFVVAAPAKSVAKPAAPRRDRDRASADGEPDLLAVLLGNIKPGQPSAKGDGSGLDEFIQTMEAEQGGVVSAEANRNGRPQRPRSQQIQQNLRECPAANTAKGVKCRQEICAVYAGRDPACPAAG